MISKIKWKKLGARKGENNKTPECGSAGRREILKLTFSSEGELSDRKNYSILFTKKT
jgi:hypothetical protein